LRQVKGDLSSLVLLLGREGLLLGFVSG
jgi:hypothetical protein